MQIRNVIPTVFLLCAICLGATYILPAQNKVDDDKKTLSDLQLVIENKKVTVQQLKQQTYDLKNDPRAIERVARENSELCRPDEKIYHFDN